MAKDANQKLKILYLMQILSEKTDETHSITMPEIITALKNQGISAERKSLYNDIESLRTYGFDIIGEPDGKLFKYRVGKRTFELAELKLLVDSVQSSKFVTEKKSNELIKKIESLGSNYEASQLQRQVYTSGRIKPANENIYYNVDILHNAINQNSKIKFQYFQWNVKKEMELRRGGDYYCVSPWGLSWDDENYYLVAYDSDAGKIKHYRVDKMLHIDLINEQREGKELFERFDMAAYAKKMFGMFAGEEESVKIECHNCLAGVIIDRFGKDVKMLKKDNDHFVATVKVAVSKQFLSWVMALGNSAKIVGPEKVVNQVKSELKRLVELYGE